MLLVRVDTAHLRCLCQSYVLSGLGLVVLFAVVCSLLPFLAAASAADG